MEFYAYDTETMEVLAIAHGETNEECEKKMTDAGYLNGDEIGSTYSPAFGAVDGLVMTDYYEEIK